MYRPSTPTGTATPTPTIADSNDANNAFNRWVQQDAGVPDAETSNSSDRNLRGGTWPNGSRLEEGSSLSTTTTSIFDDSHSPFSDWIDQIQNSSPFSSSRRNLRSTSNLSTLSSFSYASRSDRSVVNNGNLNANANVTANVTASWNVNGLPMPNQHNHPPLQWTNDNRNLSAPNERGRHDRNMLRHSFGDFSQGSLGQSSSTRVNSIGSVGSIDNRDVGYLGGEALYHEARIRSWKSVAELAVSHPHLARYVDPVSNSLALHHVCNGRPPAETVELLLRAHPDALMAADDQKGWNPLHYACRFKASAAVMELLLYKYPARAKVAATARDKQRRVPLFYAVRYDAPEGVVEMLLGVDAGAAVKEDQRGESPLSYVWTAYRESVTGKARVHKYVDQVKAGQLPLVVQTGTPFHEAWKKVEALLKCSIRQKQADSGYIITNGDSTGDNNNNNNNNNNSNDNSNNNDHDNDDNPRPQSWSEKDWSMLHAVCEVPNCHHTLFYIALGLCPDQLRLVHRVTGRTALHCAAAGNNPLLVRHLLKEWPEATQLLDYQGSTPLHLAAESSSVYHHCVEPIYNVFPSAISVKDIHGRTPLHRSCLRQHANENDDEDDNGENCVRRRILRSFPEAASHTDNKGQYPLHTLAEGAGRWDNELYEAFPKAAFRRDYSGRLPIHAAASNPGAHIALTKHLLRVHPGSARQPDARGRRLPHLACSAGWADRDPQRLRILLDASPPQVRDEADDDGWTPLHHACAGAIRNGRRLSPPLLDEVGTPVAAASRDRMGRYPLHLACAVGVTWSGGIGRLFELYPEALHRADRYKMLPLHTAMMSPRCRSRENRWLGPEERDDDQRRRRRLMCEEEDEVFVDAAEILERIDTIYALLSNGDPSALLQKI